MNTRNSSIRDRSAISGAKNVKTCLRNKQIKTEKFRQYCESVSKRSQTSLKRNQSIGQSFNKQSSNENKSKRGRGRGRPLKANINESSARKVQQNNGLPVVTIDNPLDKSLPPNEFSEANVEQNGGNCFLNFETPPELMQQFCTPFNRDYLTDESIYYLTDEQRTVSTIVSSGQECSLYVDLCKQLTQRIESECKGLNDSNLMAVLKYSLLKCFSANIDLTIDAIKNASKDITIGVSYDINNQRIIKTRAETQTNDHKTNWSGTVYTPQPKYE